MSFIFENFLSIEKMFVSLQYQIFCWLRLILCILPTIVKKTLCLGAFYGCYTLRAGSKVFFLFIVPLLLLQNIECVAHYF